MIGQKFGRGQKFRLPPEWNRSQFFNKRLLCLLLIIIIIADFFTKHVIT